MMPRQRIAYLIEPRFPGGTSSALAAEISLLREFFDIEIHLFASKMFEHKRTAPVLRSILDDPNICTKPAGRRISADTLIVQNPIFLRFEAAFDHAIFTRQLIVVTHENLIRPSGAEAFDVAKALSFLTASGTSLQRFLAPISSYNRKTVLNWKTENDVSRNWDLLEEDWHNIVDGEMVQPTGCPRDRRGRHSRPGLEKFPSLDVLDACFPATAEENVILGADALSQTGMHRPHWSMIPFQGIDLKEYFDRIDFMVYFCSPTFRESFGRVIAEATIAGKMVITDPETADPFGPGVVAAQPTEVNAIIERMIRQPGDYASHVEKAQNDLSAFSGLAFANRHFPFLKREGRFP